MHTVRVHFHPHPSAPCIPGLPFRIQGSELGFTVSNGAWPSRLSKGSHTALYPFNKTVFCV